MNKEYIEKVTIKACIMLLEKFEKETEDFDSAEQFKEYLKLVLDTARNEEEYLYHDDLEDKDKLFNGGGA